MALGGGRVVIVWYIVCARGLPHPTEGPTQSVVYTMVVVLGLERAPLGTVVVRGHYRCRLHCVGLFRGRFRRRLEAV